MKYISLFLFIILSSIACKNEKGSIKVIEPKKSNIEKPSRLDSLEQLSAKIFEKDPVRSIRFYDEMANIYGQQNDQSKRAKTHFRIANIYKNYTKDIQKASHHAHMALGVYEQMKDTLQMATLFSYCGYMSAQEGNIDFGKLQLNKAEQLFIGLNNQKGKVETYFNMAKVFHLDGDNKKAESFFKLAKNYWTNIGDTVELFKLNNFAIELYRTMNKPEMVQKTIAKNNQILSEHKVDKLLESAFNKLSKK